MAAGVLRLGITLSRPATHLAIPMRCAKSPGHYFHLWQTQPHIGDRGPVQEPCYQELDLHGGQYFISFVVSCAFTSLL